MLISYFSDKKSSHPMMTEFLFACVPKSFCYLSSEISFSMMTLIAWWSAALLKTS